MNTGRTLGITAAKKCILMILIFAMTIMAFSTVLAPQAEAASYRVHWWKSGDVYCYTVYAGKLPKEYCADFYHFDADVYKSGKVKFSFYNTCNDVNDAQVDTFTRWLGSNSKANRWYAGYIDYYTYYPYLITGWNNKNSIDDLCSKSPFINSLGTYLFVDFLSYGNRVTDMWDTLVINSDYVMLLYFSHLNATVGLRFEDAYGEPFDPYFSFP